MRSSAAAFALIILAGAAAAQAPDVKPRFDVIHNPDLYKQDTPQDTLKAVLAAIERDRYDYIVAHLLDPAYVDARLAAHQSYFERVGAEQIAATAAGQLLRGEDLQNRVQDLGTRLNVKHLADQMRRKIAEEPQNLKDFRRFAREGQFQEAGGETATATLMDVKGRALFFKKTGGRWFLENRKDDRPAKE